MSDSLLTHGLLHARLPSHYLPEFAQTHVQRRWCHPTISSSTTNFSSCFQSFPASGSFLMSQLFTSGGQGIGASASASVLLMNIQDWFPLGLTGLISLQSKGLSSVFNTTAQKHLSPWIGLNSCSLSQWCHPTISSSVTPFSYPQPFPASGSNPMNQLFASGGQGIGASASASVFPVNIQGWFPLELTGLTSLQPRGLWRVFSSTIIQKHQFFAAQPFLWSNSHLHTWLLEKP